jgi:hypothetical protein
VAGALAASLVLAGGAWQLQRYTLPARATHSPPPEPSATTLMASAPALQQGQPADPATGVTAAGVTAAALDSATRDSIVIAALQREAARGLRGTAVRAPDAATQARPERAGAVQRAADPIRVPVVRPPTIRIPLPQPRADTPVAAPPPTLAPELLADLQGMLQEAEARAAEGDYPGAQFLFARVITRSEQQAARVPSAAALLQALRARAVQASQSTKVACGALNDVARRRGGVIRACE